MSNLAKRCIFAFTAMPIVAGLLWFGDYTRWAFILGLNFIAAREWSRMVSAVHGDAEKLMLWVSPFSAVLFSMFWISQKASGFLIFSAILLLYICISFVKVRVEHLFPWLVLHFAAPLYLGLWGGMCIVLFEPGQGWEQCAKFLVVMTTLWGCDSAAYFAGRFLGKHKFSPHISPKKTWEGAIGGTLFAIFWFWIWTRTGFGYTVFDISLGLTIGFAFAISAIGQLGDLLMSALKRWSGIKDSGGIFPGHGGVLDRADSFYLAVPIAVILLKELLPAV